MNPFRRRKASNGNASNVSIPPAGGGGAPPPLFAGGGGRGAATPTTITTSSSSRFRSRGRRRDHGGAGGPSTRSAPPPLSTTTTSQLSSCPPSAPFVCHACRQPISRDSRHIHTNRMLSGQRRYHRECFVCLHCSAPIDPQGQSFCYARVEERNNNRRRMRRSDHDTEEGEEEHPFHKECLAHHLGWMCVVCEKPLPMVTKVDDTDGRSTKVEFLKHPFFERERMCPHHAGPITTRSTVLPNNTNDNNDNNNNTTLASSEEVIGEIRRCAGCHRFEPLFASPSKHFIDVGDRDTGRCVCLACCRTVVTGSEDVGPLWEKVINFFEGPLGLLTSEESNCAVGQDHNLMGVTRRALERIPVMVVGMEALNDNMRREYRSGASGHIMTRGLCLSERCGQHGRDDAGFGGVGVTAVLCLSGLPSDLTASILAHEATHAWIKLHPNFPYTPPLPLKVEEGICQLVAFLFLNDGLDPVEKGSSSHHFSSPHYSPSSSRTEEQNLRREGVGAMSDDSNPSDEKLRQYFKFCIETDDGVYGEGFRLAARAYAKMGVQELLYHVALHRDFPPL